MEARSWQELEQLSHIYSAAYSHVQVSALVCRLPKLIPDPARLAQPDKSRFSRFLGLISELVTNRLSTFDPRAIANVLWAVSKLGFSPGPPLLNKFLFEAYLRMYDFRAQELANLGWALASLTSLGNRPVPTWLQKYTLAALPRVPDLKPQELSQMTWALFKLFPPGAASPATANPSVQQPHTAAPAVTGAGMGPPPMQPSGALPIAGGPSATHPHPRAASGIESTSASEPSNSVGTSGPAAAGPASAVDRERALPALVAALTRHAFVCLPHFSSGDLAMTIYALHGLDASAGFWLLRHALAGILHGAPGSMSSYDVAEIWLILGKCAIDSSLGNELLPPSRNSDTGRLSIPASIDGANHLFGGSGGGNGGSTPGAAHAAAPVASLAPAPPPPPPVTRDQLYTLMEVVTVPALHGCTAQGLCMVLCAWARLRLHPSDAAAAAVFQRFMHVLPAQATFQCVAMSLWASAELGLRPPPPVMALFESCARLQLPASKPFERLALLWAFKTIRYRPGDAFLKAVSDMLQAAGKQLHPVEAEEMMKAFDVFGKRVPVRVRKRALQFAIQAAQTAEDSGGDGAALVVPGRRRGTVAPPLPPRWTPRAAVGFIGALVGLGVYTTPGTGRQRVVEWRVRDLRSYLASNRTGRARLLMSIEGAVCGHLPALGDTLLCVLLSALVRLKLKPRGAFAREVYEEIATRERGGGLAHGHAASLLCALGRLRMHPRPPEALLASLLAAVGPHVRTLPDSHLLGVLKALAWLRYRPSGPLLRICFAECMARVDGWSAAQLGEMLGSLAELGLQLRGAPCQKLQVVVYRRKKRDQAEAKKADGAARAEGNGAKGRSRDVAAWGQGKAALAKGKRFQGEGEAAQGKAAAGNSEKARGKSKSEAGQGKADQVDLKRNLCSLCSELSGCAV